MLLHLLGLRKVNKLFIVSMLRAVLDLLGWVFGGRYWDRTSDPCRVKAVLYR